VKILLFQLLSHRGGLFRRKRTIDLKRFYKETQISCHFWENVHIWDWNHKLQTWFLYIEKVHPFDVDWHICVDNFVLDNKNNFVEFFTTMMELNK
jgi:hypothetical protein